MEDQDGHVAESADETPPAGKSWQEKYGAALMMGVFVLLLVAMILYEVLAP